MQTVLQTLVNTDLTSITFIHDYLQLGFSNGSGLTINNSYTWSTQNHVSVIGSKVTNVKEETDQITLKFSNGEYLKISMRPEDFSCPEAILFYTENSTVPIVWN